MSHKILLLENMLKDANEITSTLENNGFVIFKTTFVELFKDLIAFHPDLIIINPESKPDREIIAIFKKLTFGMSVFQRPIILVSSRTDLDKFALTCQATAYIYKPLCVIDLCNTVKDLLSI